MESQPNKLHRMQVFSTSFWKFKSTLNADTYPSVIKWSNKSLFGSIIGKNVFYRNIAHKNTTSLKNNHNRLTAHITVCKLVPSSNSL